MFSSEVYKELCFETKDLEIIEFDGVSIPLSPSWKKVCVNLSGGADSALLMAILCSIIEKLGYQTKVDAISMNRCWSNRPWQSFICKIVFQKIKNMFPNIVQDQHFGFMPPELEHAAIGYVTPEKRSPSALATRSFNDLHCFYNEVAAVFHGRTKNSSALKDHPWRMKERDEPNPTKLCEKLKYSESYMLRPLLMIEKDWVVHQYVKNDWMELFNTTRSCEVNIDQFKRGWRFKADEPIPECGKCYWCAERKWAIEKINKE